MKKALLSVLSIFFMSVLVFTGCKSEPEAAPAPVSVKDVEIHIDGIQETTHSLGVPGHATLSTNVQLQAFVIPAQATNRNVTWSIVDGSVDVITVSQTGLVTATAAGNKQVRVTTADGGHTATLNVTVNAIGQISVNEVKIHINGTELTHYNLGVSGHATAPNTVQLEAYVLPEEALNKDVTWSIVDGSVNIITVDPDGLVTAVTDGSKQVRVTTADGGHTATLDITVLPLGTNIYVASVSIQRSSEDVNDFTVDLDHGHFELHAKVLPDEANSDVTWGSSNTSVATISNGIVTVVGIGTTTISVETVSKKEDSTSATDSFVLTVDPPVMKEPALLLYNMASSPSGGTTTVMPEMDPTTKRYTISNAETGARFASDGTANATIVYLNNRSIKAFQSISARVRIVSAVENNGTTGVIMGLMTNPAVPVANLGGIQFGGMRVTTDNERRIYLSRAATNNSGILTARNSSGYTQATGASPVISSLDGVEIPFDEEFILEVVKTDANTYFQAFLKNNATGTVIADGVINNAANVNIQNPYLGFIIAGATVEISEIVIKDGATKEAINDVLFTTPASTPTPAKPTSVILSAPTIDGDYPAYTEIHPTSAGTSLAITASVLPARAPQAVEWAVTSGNANLASQTNTGVTIQNLDTDQKVVVVTATAGTAVATLTITVTSAAIPVSSIEISEKAGKNSIMAGPNGDGTGAETLEFECDVHPHTAQNKAFTWKVYDSISGTNETAIVSIDNDGIMTITESVTADTKVYVAAIPEDTTNVESSNRLEITVKKYVAPPTGPVLKRITINGATNIGTTYNSGNSQLTMTGTGVSDGSTIRLNFVYLEFDNSKNGNFVATVRVHSYAANANNNSKAGIFAIKDVTSTSTSDIYASVLNNTAGKVAEYYTGRNELTGNLTFPGILRLTKTGNSFQCSYSNDNGQSWISRDARTLSIFGDKILLGLGVCSNSTTTGTAVFSDFTVDFGQGPVVVDLGQDLN